MGKDLSTTTKTPQKSVAGDLGVEPEDFGSNQAQQDRLAEAQTMRMSLLGDGPVEEITPLLDSAESEISGAYAGKKFGGRALEGVLQSPAWFEANKGEFPGVEAEDFFAEFCAHTLAYKNPYAEPGTELAYTSYDRLMLHAWGYEMPNADEKDYLQGSHGLEATRFDPADKEHGNSIVAFAGTEFEDDRGNIVDPLSDVNTDLGNGVGSSQYTKNSTEIDKLIQGGVNDVAVNGHSLGGAAATYAALGNLDKVKALTTFHGAGVDYGSGALFEWLRDDDMDVDHFVTDQDAVSKAGYAVDGDFHQTEIDGFENPAEVHTDYINVDPTMDQWFGNPEHAIFERHPEFDPQEDHDTPDAMRLSERYEGTTTNVSDENPRGVGEAMVTEGVRNWLGGTLDTLGFGVGIAAFETGGEIYETWSGVADGDVDVLTAIGDTGWDLIEGAGSAAASVVTGPVQMALGAASGASGVMVATGEAVVELFSEDDNLIQGGVGEQIANGELDEFFELDIEVFDGMYDHLRPSLGDLTLQYDEDLTTLQNQLASHLGLMGGVLQARLEPGLQADFVDLCRQLTKIYEDTEASWRSEIDVGEQEAVETGPGQVSQIGEMMAVVTHPPGFAIVIKLAGGSLFEEGQSATVLAGGALEGPCTINVVGNDGKRIEFLTNEGDELTWLSMGHVTLVSEAPKRAGQLKLPVD